MSRSKTQLSVLRKKFGLGKFEKTPSGRKSVSKKTDLAEQHRRLIKDELASRGKDYVGARKLAASIKEAHGVKIPVCVVGGDGADADRACSYMIRKIQRDLNPNIKWTSKPTGALDANGEPVFEIVPDSDAEEEYEIELDDDEDGDGDDDGDELVAVVDDGESDEDVSEPTAGPSRSS